MGLAQYLAHHSPSLMPGFATLMPLHANPAAQYPVPYPPCHANDKMLG